MKEGFNYYSDQEGALFRQGENLSKRGVPWDNRRISKRS
jgi:hypothetical protein